MLVGRQKLGKDGALHGPCTVPGKEVKSKGLREGTYKRHARSIKRLEEVLDVEVRKKRWGLRIIWK
jgi:hypothetical protein